MAVGSIDFPKHLTSANVSGVGYGTAWSDAVSQTVPAISLIAQDGDELAKAFDIFNAWSKTTDPDSVEITLVFPKSGGYVLALSAEYSRLARRCLGFDRSHRPMVFAPTWFKRMDSLNPFVLQFRTYCQAPIAPFLFDGVVHAGPRRLQEASSPPDLRPVRALLPLLKFAVTFIDEDQVTPNTLGWMALHLDSPNLSKPPKGPPRQEPRDIGKERAKALAHHFPVTLERFRRSSVTETLVRQLVGEGVWLWQIEQALCNLVLGRSANSTAPNSREAQRGLIGRLGSRYELASGDDAPPFVVEEVRAQVIADGDALLRHLRRRSALDLNSLQAALRSASLLDAPTAIADPPTGWTGP